MSYWLLFTEVFKFSRNIKKTGSLPYFARIAESLFLETETMASTCTVAGLMLLFITVIFREYYFPFVFVRRFIKYLRTQFIKVGEISWVS